MNIVRKIMLSVFCIVFTTGIYAFDISITGGFSNENITTKSGKIAEATVPYAVTMSKNISDTLKLSLSIDALSIFPQIFSGSLTYSGVYFTIGGGPSIALASNSLLLDKIGINIAAAWEMSGICAISAQSDFLFNPQNIKTVGIQSMQKSHIKAGVYFPNLILSFIVQQEQEISIIDTAETKEQWTKNAYLMEADAFKKGIPWRITIQMGYGEQKQIQQNAKTTAFGSIITGLKVTYDTYNNRIYSLSAQAPILLFPLDNTSIDTHLSLFSIIAGIQLKL